jgi:hypothetical protein
MVDLFGRSVGLEERELVGRDHAGIEPVGHPHPLEPCSGSDVSKEMAKPMIGLQAGSGVFVRSGAFIGLLPCWEGEAMSGDAIDNRCSC